MITGSSERARIQPHSASPSVPGSIRSSTTRLGVSRSSSVARRRRRRLPAASGTPPAPGSGRRRRARSARRRRRERCPSSHCPGRGKAESLKVAYGEVGPFEISVFRNGAPFHPGLRSPRNRQGGTCESVASYCTVDLAPGRRRRSPSSLRRLWPPACTRSWRPVWPGWASTGSSTSREREGQEALLDVRGPDEGDHRRRRSTHARRPPSSSGSARRTRRRAARPRPR